jgi:hypothetical protein
MGRYDTRRWAQQTPVDSLSNIVSISFNVDFDVVPFGTTCPSGNISIGCFTSGSLLILIFVPDSIVPASVGSVSPIMYFGLLISLPFIFESLDGLSVGFHCFASHG